LLETNYSNCKNNLSTNKSDLAFVKDNITITEAGRCTLTPPDPQLPAAERHLVPKRFQTLHLSSGKPGFKFRLSNGSTCTATPR
jgi:hypothetical protein